MQPLEVGADRLDRVHAGFDIGRDQMCHDLGVGLALEGASLGDEFVAQRLEILDDAVVYERDLAGRMRVGIVLRRRAVRGPAGVGDADQAGQRFRIQLARQIVELAFGAAAFELAVVDRADAGRVIAAIFEPPQPGHQPLRNVFLAHNADNAAHRPYAPPEFNRAWPMFEPR